MFKWFGLTVQLALLSGAFLLGQWLFQPSVPDPVMKPPLLAAMRSVIPVECPDIITEDILRQEPLMKRRRSLQLVFSRWLELDAEGAGIWMRKQPNAELAYAFGTQWGRHDPDKAWAATDSWPDEARRLKMSFRDGVLTGMTVVDLERALSLMGDHHPIKWTARRKPFREWAREDPKMALRKSYDLTNRPPIIRVIVEEWVKSDLKGAQAYVDAMIDCPSKDAALEVLMPVLVEQDPQAYENYAGDEAAMKQLAAPLLQRDPSKATQWLLRNGSERILTNALTPAFGHLFWADPDEAAKKLAKVAEVSPEMRAVGMSDWGGIDNYSDIATALMREMPAGTFRDEVFVGLFRAWGSVDGEGALSFVNDLMVDSDRLLMKAAALATMAENDLESDAAYPGSFVELIEPGLFQAAPSLGQQLASLVVTRPEEATAIVAMVPEGRRRYLAHASLLGDWSRWDPAAAFTWASQSPELAGHERAQKAYRLWVGEDSARAEAWVQAHPEAARRLMDGHSVSLEAFGNEGL